jgi:hypothetical protein
MYGTSREKESSNIERFVIFHLGLLPKGCHSGFDESASTEELCEHILYYYDEYCNHPLDSRCRYNFEDAVKFAGLASAFFSIQSTIDAETQVENNPQVIDSSTTEVILTSCTLVFIVLESTKGLIAVAQVSNASDKKKDSYTFSFTPSDIRCKVLKAHDTFTITNGGGIHSRLSGILEDQSDTGNNTMKELYDNYKYRRNLTMQQTKTPSADTDELKRKLQMYQNQYDDIMKKIPLDSIRMDLKQYYDPFLRDLGSNEC